MILSLTPRRTGQGPYKRSKKNCNEVGYFTKRGHCARLPEDFEKVYFNVLSKVLENALITLWSAAENFRSILGDIIN